MKTALAALILTLAAPAGARLSSPPPEAGAILDSANFIARGRVLASVSYAGLSGSDSISSWMIFRPDAYFKGKSWSPILWVECPEGCPSRRSTVVIFSGANKFNSDANTVNQTLVGEGATMPVPANRLPQYDSDPLKAIITELERELLDQDPGNVATALQRLCELTGSRMIPKLKEFSQSKDEAVRQRSIMWLTRFGDPAALQETVRVLSAASGGQFPQMSREASALIPGLWKTPQGMSASAAATRARQLIALAHSPNFIVQNNAGSQIRDLMSKVEDTSVFEELLPLMDEKNEAVSYGALITVCERARAPTSRGCPSTILFKEDRAGCISQVRAWWREKYPASKKINRLSKHL